ncbi:MAG: hypothetical protein QXP31_10590 [Pyrobaculum sp.]
MRSHADVHSEFLAKYVDEGRCTTKEPKQSKGAWYFHLNKSDLEVLLRGL